MAAEETRRPGAKVMVMAADMTWWRRRGPAIDGFVGVVSWQPAGGANANSGRMLMGGDEREWGTKATLLVGFACLASLTLTRVAFQP